MKVTMFSSFHVVTINPTPLFLFCCVGPKAATAARLHGPKLRVDELQTQIPVFVKGIYALGFSET